MSERRDTETLGAFVRIMRDQCKDTQARLSSRIESHEHRVRNIENGHKQPTMADLVCLAHAFDISPIELYRAVDDILTSLDDPDPSDPSN